MRVTLRTQSLSTLTTSSQQCSTNGAGVLHFTLHTVFRTRPSRNLFVVTSIIWLDFCGFHRIRRYGRNLFQHSRPMRLLIGARRPRAGAGCWVRHRRAVPQHRALHRLGRDRHHPQRVPGASPTRSEPPTASAICLFRSPSSFEGLCGLPAPSPRACPPAYAPRRRGGARQVERGNQLCRQQKLDDRCRSVQVRSAATAAPRRAKRRLAPAALPLTRRRQADFMKLDRFAAGSFDGVYAIEATCHAPDRKAPPAAPPPLARACAHT